MFRTMMRAKLHRATVTEANLNYVGSITIDEDLMDAVEIVENEKVQVVNNNNGERLETYVIKGERGSGVICLNGAAARLVQPGDKVIIICYGLVLAEEVYKQIPKIAVLDDHNQMIEMLSAEKAGSEI
ncbi:MULTISPECIES: aspartate 1-decarboxylase [unclassified Bacillus cereus group]|uniref:aspartate 1-decarboxylase n=1 Tax=unclassified Bacillus cereus group TaxID=2750818 RepID=UPI001F57E155|nr:MULTISPECIES: aspartate 1-decarboxylase [unclassified Bacillus cereus group]